MSTNSNPIPAQGNGSENTGNVTFENITYRGYVKLNDKGEIDTLVAKAEVANQTNWRKLEAAGYQLWNENEFKKYIVQSDDGFKLLVPDEAQRLYIIQAGLNYIQNSKANAYMVERKEGDDNSPKYNSEPIDLKEAINDPPSKRALSDSQKMERLMKSMGMSDAEMHAMLGELAKRYAPAETQQISAEAQAEEEEVS